MDAEMIAKALGIAVKAHDGQVDKAGKPYILHPTFVASKMLSADAIVVALLHDVVEDSNYTIEDLEAEGFSKRIIEALKLLTHKDGVSYEDYIKGIGQNSLATCVKLFDLVHNMDISRLPAVTEADMKRKRKYEKAWQYLAMQALK